MAREWRGNGEGMAREWRGRPGAMAASTMTPEADELARLDLERLPRAAGMRSFSLALVSRLAYVVAPALDDGVARAVFGPAPGSREKYGGERLVAEEFAVALLLAKAHGALTGDCSRGKQVFGPDRKSTRLNSSHLGIS